jgi:hypothetical protein
MTIMHGQVLIQIKTSEKMKKLQKLSIVLAVATLTVTVGCARKSCPAYDSSVQSATVK